ncbi:glycosyltransferase family 9 protein [Mobilicoccus massiliensis]|uniref:glycosyltransferase family 9 protein n=1 Tax=Mobilicoccus massiliensis TaxID=1522310 RepID=UPI000A5DA4A2|nr:glycosyltransferase family 9 protein [Mobilicoccus massiliensis]
MTDVVIDGAEIGAGDVLVLRALGLGDALTGVPALRALRRALRGSRPAPRIVLAANREVGTWLASHGIVDAVCVTDELAPLPQTRGGHLAVDLHGNGPASRDVLRATGPDRLVGFVYDGCPEPGPRWVADEHEAARWCRLVGGEIGGEATPADLRLAPRREPGPPIRGRVVSRTVVLHPGAASESRRWGAARWAAVGRRLAADGHTIAVTGGEAEHRLVAEVVAGINDGLVRRVGSAGGALNLCGRFELPDLAAEIGRAALVLSGDTGVAHLATAYAVPSVTLFGPISPALWGPVVDQDIHTVLWTGRDGERGDPHGTRIDPRLEAIPVSVVVTAARERLAGARRLPPGVAAPSLPPADLEEILT